MTKDIILYGSTGSIGVNTLSIIENTDKEYNIIALACNNNYQLLSVQARKFKPKYIIINDSKYYNNLKDELSDLNNITILHGSDWLYKIAQIKCDLFISAIVGIAGLMPTYNAIKAGSNIALANKESLICAGQFMMDLCTKNNINILPIDSEHNAIFQILNNKEKIHINNIILTASGGPLFNKNINLKDVTISQATNHPNWKMGKKISVDSASMMNKALEVIEAYYLFSFHIDQIDVVIHPQSIIHGLINYNDGATHAVMSRADMKVPISYALSFPKRDYFHNEILDLCKIRNLEFYEVDHKRFAAVNIAKETLKKGGNMPTIFNIANEIAVDNFLKNNITFDNIINIVSDSLDKISYCKFDDIENIIDYSGQINDQISLIAKKYFK